MEEWRLEKNVNYHNEKLQEFKNKYDRHTYLIELIKKYKTVSFKNFNQILEMEERELRRQGDELFCQHYDPIKKAEYIINCKKIKQLDYIKTDLKLYTTVCNGDDDKILNKIKYDHKNYRYIINSHSNDISYEIKHYWRSNDFELYLKDMKNANIESKESFDSSFSSIYPNYLPYHKYIEFIDD